MTPKWSLFRRHKTSPDDAGIRCHTASLSETGGRAINQDAVAHESVDDGEAWLLADGLGGHGGGEVAAETAVTTIREAYRQSSQSTQENITALFTAAQHGLRRQQQNDPDLAGMRTTLVLLLRQADRVLWAHLGDSRLYFFRDGGIHFQTKDHSVPQMLVATGDIDAKQIRHHPDRNRLLSCLGEPNLPKPTIAKTEQKLQAGDAFLLCSDGFWEYIEEHEMLADLAQTDTPQDWLNALRQRLLSRASGEHDNYSAIAIRVDESKKSS
ncbi:PP2C family protein-serine/threonine phosphatase [Methylotuvimicrobium alcaliphilum]|uniref:PPM-type phosphatase domain-containing protein n=1 Tax=Methylotuvimicrobium alcaliphilum (strain DSM 19304 / NCIMB 14124 / VKM B-2133 / 20Z) TaxID=1091494 RepID=G4T464_META2|nr:protein phosphatase 2C domain-containing protein [Methylotuvimicrobium alcaliphilum]CCE23801.1 conserved protein of unknown function [Methylotuvimicrobium alcaliphilum 20Z]